jgi:hypothetical protein
MSDAAMTPREREELALIEAQRVYYADQREHMQLEREQVRQQMRWEPLKEVATIAAGVAVMAGAILAVSAYIRPRPTVVQAQVQVSSVPPLTVHLDKDSK